ncbi:MAG TPA: hypothetical protein VNE61_05600 [Ktedonobacteraceae bacterium]|nr:hypothetical protein [Ktedonobacteraceae bacterium]
MNKIRCFLATCALLATLSGSVLLGMGSMASAASSWHARSPFAVGQVAKSVAFKPYGQCPIPGENDC